MHPVVDSMHELFGGVEVLGSQSDLHLGKKMVIAWRQVLTVRRVVKNLLAEALD
jgi:chemotaxis receptor (MCP) glutamine deamidase CheD